jgi:hypothetical protein
LVSSGGKGIQSVPEAERVVVEITLNERQRKFLFNHRNESQEQILESIARNAKHKFFMGSVIAERHAGTMPKEVVWEGRSISWDTNYVVTETFPKEEVRVVPETLIIIELR